MTVTNASSNGRGLNMSDAKVELFDVAFKECVDAGLYIPDTTSETTVVATRCEFSNSRMGAVLFGSLATATFNNCVFHDNEGNGIYGWGSTIHLHGEATAVHSNRGDGIWAKFSGKVFIHLPSHHNTSYNNGGEDRRTKDGGTITNLDEEADN